jgi:hypothetical protein
MDLVSSIQMAFDLPIPNSQQRQPLNHLFGALQMESLEGPSDWHTSKMLLHLSREVSWCCHWGL